MFLKSNNSSTTTTSHTKPVSNKKPVPSLISADMHILGNIVSEGAVDFDGTIDGNIRCNTLVLRHNGKVNGEVHAENVQIYGKVKGMIKAKIVQLHSTCGVEGIIMHEAISIEDGAIIEGKIKRTNKALGLSNTSGDGGDSYTEIEDTNLEPPKLLENIRLIAG